MTSAEQARPILVGYDGTPPARDALALAALLARTLDASLLLAWVYGPEPLLFALEDRESARRHAEQVFDPVQLESARAGELELRTETLAGDSPAAGLYELSERERPTAIVVGSHHGGAIGRLLAGSVAERLLHGSPQPVVLAPRDYAAQPPERLRTVCVGFDGRPESWTALQHAAQIASAADARLRIVSCAPGLILFPDTLPLEEIELAEQRRQFELQLQQAVASVSRQLRPEGHVIEQETVEALETESARGDCDLLVLGSRGYGPLQRVLAGSVSTALMRSAACPLMVVPRSVEFDPTATGMAGADER